jgi:hypothetical protein
VISPAFCPSDERVERFGKYLCVRPAGSDRDMERVIGSVDWHQRCYLAEPLDERNEQPHVGQWIPAPLQKKHWDGDAGQMLCAVV